MAKLDVAIFLAQLPEAKAAFEVIPEGWYQAFVSGAELRPTKDGAGKYIFFTFKIAGPTHAGRLIISIVNIENKSVAAEEIGRATLGKIMRVCGLESITDTDELIGAPVSIKLKIKLDAQYGDRNEVSDFKQIESAAPVLMPPRQQTPNPYQNAQPEAEKKAPWAKR